MDQCSLDNNILDASEDHQQTSSVTSPIHSSTQSRFNGNGNNLSINSMIDELIPRLVDYIRKQTVANDIDLNLISHRIFKYELIFVYK